MTSIKVYRVADRENRLDELFYNKEEAYKAAKGTGFWGADASVLESNITIWDSCDEWKTARKSSHKK